MRFDISKLIRHTPLSSIENIALGYTLTSHSPEGRIEKIFEKLPDELRENKSFAVLDIGSCFGETTNFFSDRYGLAIGLEKNKNALQQAREKFPYLQFIEGDGYYPSNYFFPNSFNIVFMLNVLEWTPYWKKEAMKEVCDNVKEVMAPGINYFITAHLEFPMVLGFNKQENKSWQIYPSGELRPSSLAIASSFGVFSDRA